MLTIHPSLPFNPPPMVIIMVMALDVMSDTVHYEFNNNFDIIVLSVVYGIYTVNFRLYAFRGTAQEETCFYTKSRIAHTLIIKCKVFLGKEIK